MTTTSPTTSPLYPPRERRARREAHHVLDFLAAERQREHGCETVYSGDLELLATWRWLLGFSPDSRRRLALRFPTRRLWALAWRVNTAFPPADVVAETVREWQRRQASGALIASEDTYNQINQIAVAWHRRERERQAAYQADVARCVLSATINTVGTSDELKTLAEASQWATCSLPHPTGGDLAWIAVYEAQSDTSRWLLISWCADHLSERAAPRGPHQWPASMRRSFREWIAQHPIQ